MHLDARNSQGNAGLQQWQKREQREPATECAPAAVMQHKEAGEGVVRGGAQRRGWYSPRRLVVRVGVGEGGCMGGFGWEICMREKGEKVYGGRAKAAFLLRGSDCVWRNAACPATTLLCWALAAGACLLGETPFPREKWVRASRGASTPYQE